MNLKRDRSHRGQRAPFWTLKRRRWAYSVAAATVPLGVLYGVVSGEQGAAWLIWGGALLGVAGLAAAHPTENRE